MLIYKYIPYLNVIYYCRQYNRSLFWNTLPLPKAYSKLSAAYRDVSYILSWWGGVQNSERSVLVSERKAYAELEDGHEQCRMIVEAVTMEPSRPGPTYSDSCDDIMIEHVSSKKGRVVNCTLSSRDYDSEALYMCKYLIYTLGQCASQCTV